MASVSAAYTFRTKLYQPDDGIEGLLLLGLSYDSAERAFGRSGWLYERNPAGPAVICVMRHNESRADVGLLVVAQRQVWTPEGTVNVGVFCDLVIEKGHRTLGPALKLMERAIEAADEYQLNRVYSLPNPKSAALFRRLPKARSGKLHLFTRYFDWKTMLDPRMSKPAAFTASKALGALDIGFRKVSQTVGARAFRVHESDDVTPRYDELWSEARTRYEEVGVRDARFLNWRFGESSNHSYKIFAIYSRREGKLAGYIVYRLVDDKSLLVSDFLALDNASTERTLFNAFCAFAHRTGFTKVSVWFCGNAGTTRNLMLSGFIRVGSQAMNCRYSGASVLSHDFSRTHITWADQDVQ